MTEPSMTTPDGMTCAEVTELSGLFVLDALQPHERAAVVAHLETCPEAHEEVRALGGVAPALASLAPPVDAPPELKSRVMAAYAADAAAGQLAAQGAPATIVAQPAKLPGRYSTGERMTPVPTATPATAPARSAWQLPAWASWTMAVAAVVVVAVVGVWAIGLQNRVTQAEHQAAELSQAIAAFSQPGSSVAILRDANDPNASGFAAVSPDGSVYVVMSGLPDVPAGKAYQAWYIADGQPVSAGLMPADENGLIVMSGPPPAPGTTTVAITVEPEGGSAQPTSDPIVAGDLQPA
jgi:anti-sigma-K factor RskA